MAFTASCLVAHTQPHARLAIAPPGPLITLLDDDTRARYLLLVNEIGLLFVQALTQEPRTRLDFGRLLIVSGEDAEHGRTLQLDGTDIAIQMYGGEGNPVFGNGVHQFIADHGGVGGGGGGRWGTGGAPYVLFVERAQFAGRFDSTFGFARRQGDHIFDAPHHIRDFVPHQHNFFDRLAFVDFGCDRQQNKTSVSLVGGLAGNVREEHGPALPVVVESAACGLDPRAFAEDVLHGNAVYVGDGSGGQHVGNQKPVVGEDQAKVDEHQLGDVGGVGFDVAEVGLAFFEGPPAGVGHAVEGNCRGKNYLLSAEGIARFGRRGRAQFLSRVDVDIVPVAMALVVLVAHQDFFSATFWIAARVLIFEAVPNPRIIVPGLSDETIQPAAQIAGP